DKAKQLWIDAGKPEHVEHYTIPLYAAPSPSACRGEGKWTPPTDEKAPAMPSDAECDEITDHLFRCSPIATVTIPQRVRQRALIRAGVEWAQAQRAEARDAARYQWLRLNRSQRQADGTFVEVFDEDGTLLWDEELDDAIDRALASHTKEGKE
ncbi:MAG TPA: hypothetical protein VJQ42_02085, partial [Rhodanobacteraceae bacterium]|nr:hypothetical protein [Rhodanobacteraceae bacterium]